MESIRKARSVIFEEFLVWPELAALMDFVRTRERIFRQSQIVLPSDRADQSDPGYRRSRVTLQTGPFGDLVAQRILFHFPIILRALGHPMFEIRSIEAQITASNDGDFFKTHNDNTHADAPSREITFVYFFHREPRPFTGGELLIYDSRISDGIARPGRVRRRIAPKQNQVVFFPSCCLHEILPVRCPTQAFVDSRFTLNGWVHR